MPRYYIDIQNGDRLSRDDEGGEFSDLRTLRDEAVGVLPQIARDTLPDGDRHEFVATVRDDADRPIFRARLTLTTEWLAAPTGRSP